MTLIELLLNLRVGRIVQSSVAIDTGATACGITSFARNTKEGRYVFQSLCHRFQPSLQPHSQPDAS
nr:hypothetical protein SHINE37_41119 [Rhizobiaceae bacterium]